MGMQHLPWPDRVTPGSSIDAGIGRTEIEYNR